MCGKTSVKPSTTTTGTATATTVDPFDEFKPFLESISEEVAAVLAIPYFDNMYGPPANRTSILFHLHFKHVDSSQTSNLRNRFRLDESVRQVTPGDFISWLRATVPGAESVVPQYERMFAEIKMTDARKAATVAASAGTGSVELTASIRLICTAQNEIGRFMGLRTSVVTLQTRTRSGLDPRNRGMSFDKPLRAIINDNIDHSAQLTANSNAKTDEDAATEHASARSLTLLKRVVKEFLRDDTWAQRAHDSGPIDQDDPWDDLGLAARAIQLGVDEKVMLGGRDRKAFIYAVPVPGQSRCGPSVTEGLLRLYVEGRELTTALLPLGVMLDRNPDEMSMWRLSRYRRPR